MRFVCDGILMPYIFLFHFYFWCSSGTGFLKQLVPQNSSQLTTVDFLPGVDFPVVLNRMEEITNEVMSKQWARYPGKPVTDVVNICIGGSDLGSLTVIEALEQYSTDPKFFVKHWFVIWQKQFFSSSFTTFTTQETITNATTTKESFLRQAKDLAVVALSTNTAKVEEFGKRKLAFLDLLLQSKEGFKLSDQELREEVDTFMFAGHDTLSSAVSFALYSLAANPEIQEKAYKEQYELFGESNEQPTYADLQEMKYLERVVKEVLRLYPSAPIIGRELCEDFILPDDCLVPKGAQLIINIFALHRDPEVWPEPEKFNPDNFLPEAVQSRSPYSYIPFSAGPRNCIGQKYALLAMKATISWVLRKYKILPSPYREHKLHLAAEIVLLSTNGYHIQIKIRE